MGPKINYTTREEQKKLIALKEKFKPEAKANETVWLHGFQGLAPHMLTPQSLINIISKTAALKDKEICCTKVGCYNDLAIKLIGETTLMGINDIMSRVFEYEDETQERLPLYLNESNYTTSVDTILSVTKTYPEVFVKNYKILGITIGRNNYENFVKYLNGNFEEFINWCKSNKYNFEITD